jgi:hypothetical protein
VAAKKRKKVLRTEINDRPSGRSFQKRLNLVVKPVLRDNYLAKNGAREPVSAAYFASVYGLFRDNYAWGNQDWNLEINTITLEPESLFPIADEIIIKQGSRFTIHARTVLVVRGRQYSIILGTDYHVDPAELRLSDWRRPLTLGAALKVIRKAAPGTMVWVTKMQPRAIAESDMRVWSLVVGSGGRRAWMREADLKISSALVVRKETVLLHAFMNCPGPDWAAF